MRPSVLRLSQTLLRSSHEASKCRNFATSTSKRTLLSIPVCQFCNWKLPNSQQAHRRWQSSAATFQSSAGETLKNNPIPKTHYEFFPQTFPHGPPPLGPFQIDPRALRREFLQLQAVAHPDRHPSSLKARAEATSARINEAYKTLQNPLLRAQYLLSLGGIDVAEDETAKVEDPELLMEVLDAREEIEAAEREEDLVEMRRVNENRIGHSEEIIEKAFSEDDLEKARVEVIRLRYWVNIQESLDAWEKGKPVVLVH